MNKVDKGILGRIRTILQNWLTNVSIISWAACGRTIYQWDKLSAGRDKHQRFRQPASKTKYDLVRIGPEARNTSYADPRYIVLIGTSLPCTVGFVLVVFILTAFKRNKGHIEKYVDCTNNCRNRYKCSVIITVPIFTLPLPKVNFTKPTVRSWRLYCTVTIPMKVLDVYFFTLRCSRC